MDDVMREAMRLLEEAQAGGAHEALDRAGSLLRRAGDRACLHFVRAVCHDVLGDPASAESALDDMLTAADAEGSPGWRACALGTRAGQRARLGETHAVDYDLDGVMRDLVEAERFAVTETEPVAAVHARVSIALALMELRLYELVGQHYEAAYEICSLDASQSGKRPMWLINLAELHLHWALELYQVGQAALAESHTAQAEEYATRAAAEVSGPAADVWRSYALLAAACAKADRHDPAAAALEIADHQARLQAYGMSALIVAFCQPFHAVALRRTGRPGEALRLIEHAVATLPGDAGVLITSATHHTHALLLAGRGSADAKAGLAYGATLAAALWQQRQRTLHSFTTMKSLDLLRRSHEQAARAADLDALTGIANRRAFDEAVRRTQDGDVAVLMIDTDKFKQINDTAGHDAGDAALRAIAAALTAHVRDEDLVARLGGDEFAVLLPGLDAATAYEMGRRMVDAVRALPDCPATLSVGVAGGPAVDLQQIVRRADAAMYRAKRRGGDDVEECESLAVRPTAA
ncbi:diguanylate cyclase [Paractinoplanes deccanensis]|uniref:Diguanylate cyclase n=1 Tax=Paractinoplanes deccanensis TaxID=113561 RepID=A0ABQ3YAA9_9ACTN|nr:GGDEF domain-containing protein [Actinoplanes deccanensis]GID76952.1 diguanylate cyclase [Actinoplanes deccanensis]